MINSTTYYINGSATLCPGASSTAEIIAQSRHSDAGYDAPVQLERGTRARGTDITGVYDYISKRKLRRLDHFSRLCLYGACLALDDATLLESDLCRTGLAVASCYGATNTNFAFLDSFLDDGDKLSSPTHFSSSLHNAAPSYISMLCKTHGPAISTSNAGLGTAYTLLQAMAWLDENIVDNVIIGGVEEYSSILAHCIEGSGKANECLEQQVINGTFVGEGAGFFILSKTRGDNCYAKVCKPSILDAYQLSLQADKKVFISPMGIGPDLKIYEKICSQNPVVDSSHIFSYHPSSQAIGIACAAHEVKKGGLEEAYSLNVYRNQGALITITAA